MWQTDVEEKFEVTGGQAEDTLVHDAAGNLTYDGLQQYTYDAWNRLVKVERAYRGADGNVAAGGTVAIMEYDGLSRRVQKTAGDGDSNSDVLGEWEATFHYYHDGQRMIETRNGTNTQTVKQYVWGLMYIDELCQIAVNQDPANADAGEATENLCERFFYALQDTNFNVLGVITHTGTLVERYEYTPYGRRTIYSHNWSLGDMRKRGQEPFLWLTGCVGGV